MKNGSHKKTDSRVVIKNVKMVPGPDTDVHYVNYMSVSHLPFDFTISALRIPAELPPDQAEQAKKGELRLEPAVQLVVPPIVIKGLIEALKTQVDRYEEIFGKILTLPVTQKGTRGKNG